jgi:hypothetical protein
MVEVASLAFLRGPAILGGASAYVDFMIIAIPNNEVVQMKSFFQVKCQLVQSSSARRHHFHH